MFHSRMAYGLQLWGESSHAEKIFILQKKAIRAIERVNQWTHCKPLFRKYGITTLAGTYIYQQILRARKEQSNYHDRGQDTGFNLRSSQQRTIPFHRTAATSAQHRHLQLLNALPQHWLNKPLPRFAAALKRLLTDNAFYSVPEFFHCARNLQEWVNCHCCCIIMYHILFFVLLFVLTLLPYWFTV